MTNLAAMPQQWRKSSRSSGGNGNTCVEVGATELAIAVRDTKFRDGGMLTMTPTEWRGYLASIASGDLDG